MKNSFVKGLTKTRLAYIILISNRQGEKMNATYAIKHLATVHYLWYTDGYCSPRAVLELIVDAKDVGYSIGSYMWAWDISRDDAVYAPCHCFYNNKAEAEQSVKEHHTRLLKAAEKSGEK
jgi:hypothetical protein